MLKLKNPLPQMIQDTGDLKQVISGFKLIPYYGTTEKSSHSFLSLLYNISDLSPSQGNCLSDLTDFAFQGDLWLKKKSIPGLKSPETEVSQQEAESYNEALNDIGLTFIDIRDLTKSKFRHGKISGNKFIRYQEIEVAGEKQVKLEVLHPLNVMYIEPEEGYDPHIVWALKFDRETLSDPDEYLEIPIYPNFKDTDFGRETVFHFKYTDKKTYYGKPKEIQSLHWQLNEFLLASLAVKVNSTEMVSKVGVAVEGPPQDDDDEEAATQRLKDLGFSLREVATAKGDDPSAMAVFEYNHGGQEPVVLNFQINRDPDWFESQIEVSSQNIFSAHKWPRQLNGFKDAKSSLGGDMLINLFLIKNASVISPIQQEEASEWSVIFKQIAEFTENEIFNEYSFEYPDVIGELIESLNAIDQARSNSVLEPTE